MTGSQNAVDYVVERTVKIVPVVEENSMEKYVLTEPTAVFRVMLNTGMCAGTGEAKRLLREGGVRLDGELCQDFHKVIDLGAGETKVLQIGRRKFVQLVTA